MSLRRQFLLLATVVLTFAVVAIGAALDLIVRRGAVGFELQLTTLCALVGLLIVVGSCGVMLLDRLLLRRLNDLHDSVHDIAEQGDFSARVPDGGGDELSSLGSEVNRMLSRVERDSRARIESEERFRTMADHAPVMIWTSDIDGRRDFVSASWLRFTGRQADALDGWTEDIHPDDREAYERTVAGARMRDLSYQVEYRLARSGRDYAWVIENATPRRVGDKVVGYIGSVLDVTSRKLQELERIRLTSFVDQAAEGMMITERDGRILYVNPAFERTTQYSAADVIGKRPSILKSGQHDGRFYASMWETILAGGIWCDEVTNRRKDGSLYTEQTTILPIRDLDGHIANFMAISQDTTTRRGLEAQLRQAMKMEAVGRLAGGIAHDFNNLLTVILGYTETGDPESGALDGEAAGAIRGAAERAAALTQQLLAFSRQQVLQPRILDVNEVVRGISTILRRIVGEDIELVVPPLASLPNVKADRHQLEQVLMNLVVNARDAMPRGGRLTIETSAMDFDAAYVLAHVSIAPGSYVVIAVTDTGIGIEKAALSRIFEPFYTTKDPGKGTGLGLATVYGIVRQSGGHVLVYSEVGKGTTFKVCLPIAPEERAAAAEPEASADPAGRETVLLVEDEEAVRRLLRVVLRKQGYTIIEASSGDEALAFAEKFAGTIDLLITDLVMPEMNGHDLALKIAEQRPDTKILFMSGYTEHAVLDELVDGSAFVQKPFTPAAIGRVVRDVLDGSAVLISHN